MKYFIWIVITKRRTFLNTEQKREKETERETNKQTNKQTNICMRKINV